MTQEGMVVCPGVAQNKWYFFDAKILGDLKVRNFLGQDTFVIFSEEGSWKMEITSEEDG